MRNPADRKLSVGTRFMLVLTILVLIGTVMVLLRLSNGNQIDLSKIRMGTVHVAEDYGQEPGQSGASGGKTDSGDSGSAAAKPADSGNSGNRESAGTSGVKRFTLTAAGTAAVEGEVRKNSYLSDMRVYDFSDIMALLRKELTSDVNLVFIENIIADGLKVSDTVVPSSAAAMLKSAGFSMAACGFSGAWNQGEEGVARTREALEEAGITPVGIYIDLQPVRLYEFNGIRAAFLQYTDTIPDSTRKKMNRENLGLAVPPADPEAVAADIAAARSMGADVVIVLVNWGKQGKAPDKKQKALAQEIADAGADLIIGSGSRIPQAAEYLETSGGDGYRKVMCVWSPGVLISGEQTNAKRKAGYLFHAEITLDPSAGVTVSGFGYTPVYTWKYRQDGRTYYRCLAANREAPDGMDSDQAKAMNRAMETTEAALADSPLAER